MAQPTLNLPVYRDRNGLWFWRCGDCVQFDGAFKTENAATVALWNHRLRSHA